MDIIIAYQLFMLFQKGKFGLTNTTRETRIITSWPAVVDYRLPDGQAIVASGRARPGLA
jgi:hypothetical protein